MCAGVLLAYCLKRVRTQELPPIVYFAVAALMLSVGMVVYFLLQAIGSDPIWTLEMALKHCMNTHWVHAHKTRFHYVVRDSSFILGKMVDPVLLF